MVYALLEKSKWCCKVWVYDSWKWPLFRDVCVDMLAWCW